MKIGHLLLRLAVGGFFIGHGTQKLFGWFGGHGLGASARASSISGCAPAAPTRSLPVRPRPAEARCCWQAPPPPRPRQS